MRSFIKLGVLILISLSSHSVFAKASDIPVKDFFRNPSYTSMELSPNGKYLAMLSPVGNRRNIVVMETEGLKNVRAVTGLKHQDVAGFSWANNEDIVFTMDSDGNEAFSIYKVDTSEKTPKIVTLVGAKAKGRSIVSASLVHSLPEDPDHIIVQYNGRKSTAADLYLLPLDSKWSENRRKNPKMKMIAKNPGNVAGWIVDQDGNVRGAFEQEGLQGRLLYKDKDAKKFTTVREFNVFDETITPLGFDFDNQTMYVASNIGRDKNAIYKYDIKNNKLGEMIYGHDLVDVTGLTLSRKQKKLISVSYVYEYPETVYFDKAEEQLMKGLQDAFKGKRVSTVSRSEDETLRVVLVNSDNDPGVYYLYDSVKNNATPLVERMSWLNPDDLSPMKPIKFKSRDGLTLHGYLTIPKDSNGKKLPLIVNPHGGPFGVRDVWGYNSEHQFFASRGYATVQVNFRGSGGYGREFQQAGYNGKWGAEMQNDLTDAVKYLIKEGIADADKVCIYGGSYGGYATMAGLTFTPELYQCGINNVGVTDVGLLFESMPSHWEIGREEFKVQVGDPEDKELMKRMSPLAHVDQIKAPLMIIHGARDPRVVKQHAFDLRNALEDRGVTLSDDEWIYKTDEGHGFRKEENRIEQYTKMEKFLAKFLK